MVAYRILLLILLALTFGPLFTEKNKHKTWRTQLGTTSGILTIITLIVGWVMYG